MKKIFFSAILLLILGTVSCGKQEAMDDSTENQSSDNTEYTGAEIITSFGTIEIVFNREIAPKTSENFIRYAKSGFFSNTIFHRVIKGFMIQGGGFDTDFKQKRTYSPVINEASKNAPNKRATVAMARTSNINSATSQFFINLVDNDFLNHRDDTDEGYGYCVFGEVVKGMDIVDKIASVPTSSFGSFQDVPQDQVIIKEVKLISR